MTTSPMTASPMTASPTTSLNPWIDDCLLFDANSLASAQFKSIPADFVVDEQLDWQWRGTGEHIFLNIQKTNSNTLWVAKQLAKFYQVPIKDIGYSGLKDRHAVTTQYFSVRLPGVKPGAYALPTSTEFTVGHHVLHDKKLKRGQHRGNTFCIRLRHVVGNRALIEERLAYLTQQGMPNFFDSQRFGHDAQNLIRVTDWVNGHANIAKRTEKSLLISALRAAIFNAQLAMRVKQGSWNQAMPNDTMCLAGSHSFFQIDQPDDVISKRLQSHDIHPAGVLPGKETALNSAWFADDGYPFERDKLQDFMNKNNLSEQYRAFRVSVKNLSWQWEGEDCCLQFSLPNGAYASAVIKQIFAI
ncbi:tRNA pseudouridine(13) synthase TruD [Ostreibacterium oceani]|uniref:tRNA pseudouridine(13) synthase TruD n=1 Tax=Ostreibacterium oceani TaxID=2654998 RepID=A0A6N7EVP1_9GAMM|nr:tRNA pseudouridine(13) synthase TruD [Ostreibacterium oceani]MPV86552.1 tRNA pseudouridine(13) synthase TruD [Ostreibacterium oceani]